MDIVSGASSGEKEVATDAEKLVEQPAEQPMEQPVEKPEQVEKAEQPVEKPEQPAEKEKKDPEPNFQLLVNPARVLPQQVRPPCMILTWGYMILHDLTRHGGFDHRPETCLPEATSGASE